MERLAFGQIAATHQTDRRKSQCLEMFRSEARVKAADISDFRAAAKAKLPHFLFEYMDGGSYAETTLRRNVADLQAISLKQRVLRDVSKIDLSTELFGRHWSLPVALAPVGLGGLYARRGEVQAARAADAAGVPFCLSTVGVCPIEEVSAAIASPIWFQLYVLRDRGVMRNLLARAKAAGCTTLVFTVDLPVPGARYRDMRSGLSGAAGLSGRLNRAWQIARKPGWAYDVGLRGGPHNLGNVASLLDSKAGLLDFFAWVASNFDPSVTWADLEFIRESWDGSLIIKGILDPDDAKAAIRLGADGVVVSNHGGHGAVGDDLTILADGGVRSGLDVVRMIALGADGVLVGRAWVNALAAEGGTGVSRMLSLLASEMRVAMALTGVTRIADITSDILASRS